VIGNVRLDKLTPAHVQRLVTQTRNSTTSRGTPPGASLLRHVYKLIRNTLGDAFRMELVTRNVATQVKAPPLNTKRRVGLDLAEARRLLEVIDGERLEALYVLALTTGLRRGGLLALRWDDIDLGSRQLHVRRAMQRVDGKLRIAEPKTSSARRTVVLSQFAVRSQVPAASCPCRYLISRPCHRLAPPRARCTESVARLPITQESQTLRSVDQWKVSIQCARIRNSRSASC
jgi:integrase